MSGKRMLVIVLSGLLMTAGVLLMLYPFFTDVRAWLYQRHALERMESVELVPGVAGSVRQETGLTENPVVGDGEPKGEEKKPAPAPPPPPLPAVFVIEIPKIGLKAAVAKGTTSYVLSRGPGWYEHSAMPGEGNTAVAAHRNMYGS